MTFRPGLTLREIAALVRELEGTGWAYVGKHVESAEQIKRKPLADILSLLREGRVRRAVKTRG